jgi:hypothetical protein
MAAEPISTYAALLDEVTRQAAVSDGANERLMALAARL